MRRCGRKLVRDMAGAFLPATMQLVMVQRLLYGDFSLRLFFLQLLAQLTRTGIIQAQTRINSL
jgi:hypothetical protein